MAEGCGDKADTALRDRQEAAMSTTAHKRATESGAARTSTADSARTKKPAVKKAPAPPTKKVVRGTTKTVPGTTTPGVTVTPLPVREGEEPWSASEVAEIEQELLADADRLRSEIAVADQGIADLLRDSGEGAGDDQADTGTKNFEREHEMSIANNARDMLMQTERALARIAAGTYGACESCGQPIGKARLQVFPRATLCVSCKQREERR
jgi:DnaK suppressor protein